jgi:hypothetical protein
MKPKKIILIILVVFAVYAVVKDPTSSASVVHSAWNILWDAVLSVRDFFDAVIKG